MNLHAAVAERLTLPHQGDDHDDEEDLEDNPVCPDCNSTRFRQLYWGSFSALRYLTLERNRRPDIYTSDPDIDTDDGAEEWECNDCQAVIPAALQPIIQTIWDTR